MTSLGARETGDYAYFFADKATAVSPGVLPGGYPVEDLEVLILDEAGRPVPDGEPGELAVRGPYAALGYRGRPRPHASCLLPGSRGRAGRRLRPETSGAGCRTAVSCTSAAATSR